MNWHGTVLSLIDLRSFSSLWFWIALAVTWSAITHNPLGLPWDMVQQARRRGGQHMADLEALVAIQIRRRAAIIGSAGVVLAGLWAMALTALAILGFGYGLELSQALTLLFAPLTVVGLLRLRLMAALSEGRIVGEALCKRLTWHRAGVQAIGLAAILATSLWGMWFNINVRALGG